MADPRGRELCMCLCMPCMYTFGRVAVMKIKTTKINSEGLLRSFTNFSTPENYQPYDSTHGSASIYLDMASDLSFSSLRYW